ncbi:conjugal transfer protein TraF [Desulfurobacterium sp.]
MKLKLTTAILLSLFVVKPTYASWFDYHETGWFWNENQTKSEKKEKKLTTNSTKKQTIKQTVKFRPTQNATNETVNTEAEKLLKLPEVITEKDLDKLTPKQIGRLWQAYIERALYMPNRKDYENILRIQNYAIKKSMLYTIAMQDTLRRNPQWNPEVKNPSSVYGRRTETLVKEGEIRRYIEKWKDKAGLYFFFESTCPYCAQQARVLQRFQKQYGWTVFPITTDGKCIDGYENCKVDTSLVFQKLGIKYFPAIYLVIPHGKNGKPLMQPISFGLITKDKLTKTLYKILYMYENGRPPGLDEKLWKEVKDRPNLKEKPTLPKDLTKAKGIIINNEEKKAEKFDEIFWK